jgi:hypothetical protein
MKTSNMICKALFTCLILCCIALINTQVYGQYYKRGMIPVTPPVGGFAVDGDALANTCPDSPAAPNNVGDWFYNPVGPGGSIFNAAGEPIYPMGPGTMFIHFIDAFKSGDQTVFGSSNKIFDHPDTYLIQPGNVPPKDDMQHASAFFTYGNPALAGDPRFSFTSDDDELWCLFAADRWKTNGESYIDFEFNQNTMELVGTKIVSSAPERDGDGDLTGGRTPGDVLITIYFEGGGSQATLILDKWEKEGPGTSYNWIRKNIDTDFPANSVFCTHNIGECPAPWDIYDETDRIYSINQYAEGAINLSKVMGDGKCGTLSSVWARTKSSTSTSAELKDLAGPPFHVGLELSGPEANCPADKVVPACTSVANILSAYNTWKAGFTATPGEGVEPIVPTFSPALPTAPPANAECTGWTITTTYTLTDDCGRTDFCSSTFTVMPDLVAPVLPTLPTGGDLGCNPTLPTCVTGLVATDECDGQIVVQCVPGEITGTACNKSQTFTYTATDHCGHASSATVTYTWKQDITAPVLANLPTGGDLGCNPTPPVCSTAVTANDACDGTRTVTCTPGNITGDCVKTQTFTYTATDICGNSSTANVTYTWKVDITPPVLANVPAGGNLGCNPTPPTCSTAVTANDACDGTRTVTCNAGAITGDCVKTQTFTYTATDICGNSSTANVTYTWKVDTEAPVPTTQMSNMVFECNEPVIMPNVAFSDNCDGPVNFTSSIDGQPGEEYDTYSFPVGESTIHFMAIDACQNSTEVTITVTLLPCKEEFCTYTQGFFGNQKGKACDLEEMISGDLFTAGLLAMGDLKIGCPSIGNYILFQAGDAALIRQILPGGSGIGVISGMCDASNPCLNQYLSRGTLNNALIAQTLVLGLNLRISTGLDGVPLEAGKWLTTQKKLFCEEGTGVVQKQCSDGIMVVDPYWYYMLPEKVLCYMDEEGYDMTVGGLYMLANEALGQHVDLPMMCGMTEVKLTDIAMAVDMINNAFDGCRAFVGNLASQFVCPPVLSEAVLSGGLEIAYLRVYPNPFETSVTFEFISEQDADARLEIFNMLGQKVSTLMDQPVRERVLNRVEYQPEGIISEFLIYKLTLDNRVYNGKLIYKNE